MNDDVVVSVLCTAYNHEKYIRSALDGFVNQKTNFRYEVLINDDASTDHTAAIIAEYEAKYPDIIKPVYQTENQYSKGVSITKSILFPQSKGKYTAICEGDDYWCDENKLQKQVDFLESHEGYAACVHNTRLMDCRTGGSWPMYKGDQDRDLTFKEVVNYSAACFHTSSILCRREWFCIPDELRANGFGDYPRAVYMRLNGKIHYLKDIMSVYRMFTAGSWTARNQNNASNQQRICSQKARTDFTEKLRRYCREQGVTPEYQKAVNDVANRDQLQLAVLQKGGRCLLHGPQLGIFMGLSLEKKIHVLDTVRTEFKTERNEKR